MGGHLTIMLLRLITQDAARSRISMFQTHHAGHGSNTRVLAACILTHIHGLKAVGHEVTQRPLWPKHFSSGVHLEWQGRGHLGSGVCIEWAGCPPLWCTLYGRAGCFGTADMAVKQRWGVPHLAHASPSATCVNRRLVRAIHTQNLKCT